MAAGEYLQPFLTLMGSSDNGKTHLLIAICRSWLEQGKLARYAFVPLLLDELRAGFAQGNDGTYEEALEEISKCAAPGARTTWERKILPSGRKNIWTL